MKCEKCEDESCSCDFWSYFLDNSDMPEHVRVDGQHYYIGSGIDMSRGFGGQQFVIEFFDGRRVETHNLWHNGQIPAGFRERLPDNSRFVE